MNLRPYLPSPGHNCDHCDRKLEERALAWTDGEGWVYCSLQCGDLAAGVRNDTATCDLFATALPRLAHQNERTA